MNQILFLYLFIHTTLASSTQKLYYYGQPTVTVETGFIKMDPDTGAREPAALGFATNIRDPYTAYKETMISPDQSTILMCGSFALWNNTYVGGILKIDATTLEASVFNSGVLGNTIQGMGYFANSSQIAMIGDFYAFQQNPSSQLNSVGACSVDGSICYPLANGIEDYGYSGSVRSIGSVVFLLFENSYGASIVTSLNTSIANQQWTTIYESNDTTTSVLTMELYQNNLWLFGYIITPTGQNVSAARWNFTKNSWDYIYISTPIQISTEKSSVQSSVSPNGQNAYMFVTVATISTLFKWNDYEQDWTEYYTMVSSEYGRIALAASDDGALLGCKPVILLVTDPTVAPVTLPEISCSGGWIGFSVNMHSQLYAFCNAGFMQIHLYNLTTQHSLLVKNLSILEDLTIRLTSMCVYGQKMLISGVFQLVGETPAYRIAAWDNSYQKWYAISSQSNTVTCYCGVDGDQMAAVCTQSFQYPMLILDSANSDSGTGQYIAANLYNLTNFANYTTIDDAIYVNGVVYIACSDKNKNVTLASWTPTDGLKLIITVEGFYFSDVVVFQNIAYITGSFWVVNSSSWITAARYSLLNNTWLDMDQLYDIEDNTTKKGATTNMVYWEYTNQIYVAGQFDKIGSMRVSNWGGYNLEGQAADSVGGGVPDWVYFIQPIGDRMYLTTQQTFCPLTSTSSCTYLLYYGGENQVYSYQISTGVGAITAGYDTTNSVNSDEGSGNSWTDAAMIASAVLVLSALLLVAAVFLYRKVWLGKRRLYQEIPDMLASVESAGPIDFQHEEFVMKSVLGRGAYGTVWSCVFPQREGATFAVKQMLFSKGETKKINIVKQEIDILEKFRHPHIVHYCGHQIETTQTSIEFFIFMELYEQPCSLKGDIQKRTNKAFKTGKNEWFSYQEVKDFLFQISDGLEYLHRNGVAHRDLKCANILVRTKGSVIKSLHIADFGISRIMSSEEGAVNVLASTVLGTPSFMAPEIFKNQPYDAFKADMWSFGMLMYEMLSWKEPEIPGQKPSFSQEVMEFMNQDHHFLSVLEIFGKCTQMDPNSRPTASELLSLCENLP